MTEGLLNTKIRELEEVLGPDLTANEVLHVLDEAKKDYPEWVKPEHAPGKFPTEKEIDEALIRHSRKESVWYKKWFGDSP